MKNLFICNAHWIFPALMQHFSTAVPAGISAPTVLLRSQSHLGRSHGVGSSSPGPGPESHPKATGCGPDIPKFIPTVEQGGEISVVCAGVKEVRQPLPGQQCFNYRKTELSGFEGT